VIGGSWKVPILWHLSSARVKRISALLRDLGGVTPKMLTQQLRELERDRIVLRKVYAQVPPRVEYSLTVKGRSLLPIVAAMCRWGSSTRSSSCGR
jgi:DNA-binding HxlR family transcriptional regulator